MTWWTIAWGVASGVVLVWAAVVAALWWLKPDDVRVGTLLRLLPDVVRLLGRLARDSTLPRGIRIRLWLLLGYLAMPLDLVPDFVPVVGYADDAIVVGVVLRSVIKHAGPEALERHWPGTADGLAALRAVVHGR